MTFKKLRANLIPRVITKIPPRPDQIIKPYRLPIVLSGGIGDVVMSMGLVQKLKTYLPVDIYTRHQEVYSLFFKDPCYPPEMLRSSMHLFINSIVSFRFTQSFENFPSDTLSQLYSMWKTNSEKWKPEINYHPFLDNQMAFKAQKLKLNRRTLPWSMLGLKYNPLSLEAPKTDYFGKYITVHNGFETNQSHIKGRSTKNWSLKNWEKFVKDFKKKYPEIKVIQLGSKTGEPIPGVDIDFKNFLTINGSFTILANSLCHLDGDSGLVHAANAFGVKSVVMFGSTPSKFFGYDENINLESKACPEGGSCWWLNDTWLEKCPLGLTTPKCLDYIKPDQVLNSVEKIIQTS